MRIRKTIFGRVKLQPNLFIGGVSATINTAAILATRLGVNQSIIKGFRVIGLNIECTIIANYFVGTSAFQNDTSISYYKDDGQFAKGISNFCFSGSSNLSILQIYGLTSFSAGGFPKISGTKIKNLLFPNAINTNQASVGNKDIINNLLLETFEAPLCNYSTGNEGLSNLPLLKYIDLRVTTRFGRSNQPNPRGGLFFPLMANNGLIKVHEGCLTVDNGGIDINLQKLINRNWTVEFYNNAGIITSTIN
jgi:hypothetical protein